MEYGFTGYQAGPGTVSNFWKINIEQPLIIAVYYLTTRIKGVLTGGEFYEHHQSNDLSI